MLSHETQRSFDDVLASIARARAAKSALQVEFARHNSVRYLVLETGAEAFAFARRMLRVAGASWPRMPVREAWARAWGLAEWVVGRMASATHQAAAAAVAAKAAATTTQATATGEDARIRDLMTELARLKEEMKALTGATSPLATASTGVSCPQDPPPPAARKALPFNANMLTAVKLKKTSSSSSSSSASTTDESGSEAPPTSSMSRKHKVRNEDSINEVLQRVLREKFKNVRVSSPSCGDEDDNAFNSSGMLDTENCENAATATTTAAATTTTTTATSTKRPPVPPRPNKVPPSKTLTPSPLPLTPTPVLSARNR